MNTDSVIAIGNDALYTTILVAAPLLLSALAVGLLVGVFQAATQINEMTLSFIPKLGVLVLMLFLFGPWLLSVMTDYMRELMMNVIPAVIRSG